MKVTGSKLKIFIDMDNVVADWSAHAVQTMGLDANEPELRKKLESQEGITGILDCDELWKRIGVAGANWWHKIPLLPWSRKLWHVCNKIAPTAFLSKPWNEAGADIMGAACDGKVRWVREHYRTDNLFLGVYKEFCAAPNALLIDDSTQNCEAFREAGGFAFHWPNHWKMRRNGTWTKSLLDLLAFIGIVAMPHASTEEAKVIDTMQATFRRLRDHTGEPEKVTI